MVGKCKCSWGKWRYTPNPTLAVAGNQSWIGTQCWRYLVCEAGKAFKHYFHLTHCKSYLHSRVELCHTILPGLCLIEVHPSIMYNAYRAFYQLNFQKERKLWDCLFFSWAAALLSTSVRWQSCHFQTLDSLTTLWLPVVSWMLLSRRLSPQRRQASQLSRSHGASLSCQPAQVAPILQLWASQPKADGATTQTGERWAPPPPQPLGSLALPAVGCCWRTWPPRSTCRQSPPLGPSPRLRQSPTLYPLAPKLPLLRRWLW